MPRTKHQLSEPSPIAYPAPFSPLRRRSLLISLTFPKCSGAAPYRIVQDLPKSSVDLVQHRRPRAEVFRLELVERRVEGVEVGVEVFGVGGYVQEAGEDFTFD